MFNRTKHVLSIAMFAFVGLSVAATAAHAATGPTQTITSKYDDLSADSLTLVASASPASCYVSDYDGSTHWSRRIYVRNAASSTNVDIQSRGGGLRLDQENDTFIIDVAGTNLDDPSTTQFVYTWEVDGTSQEIGTVNIPPARNDCSTLGTPPTASPTVTPSASPTATSTASPVTCLLNNYTDPSAQNEDHSYPVSTLISMTVHITDPGARTRSVSITATEPNGSTKIVPLDGLENGSYKLTAPGEWQFNATLRDVDGTVITTNPAGGCSISITARDAAATPAPTTTQSPVTVTSPIATPTATHAPLPLGITVVPTASVTPVANSNGAASADTLPMTGTNTTFLVALGVLLLGTGVVFMILSRKRTPPIVDPSLVNLGKALSD